MVDTSCDWVRPIWLHPDDEITRRTAEQIVSHNETWLVICGP